MKNPVAKHMYKTSRSSVMVNRKKQSKIGPDMEEYESMQDEFEKLRKDAERYRYIKKGNQWIIAATQTGFQIDGEDLDDLIDSEMEQQK